MGMLYLLKFKSRELRSMSSIAQEYFGFQFDKEITQNSFGILDSKNSQPINMNVLKN